MSEEDTVAKRYINATKAAAQDADLLIGQITTDMLLPELPQHIVINDKTKFVRRPALSANEEDEFRGNMLEVARHMFAKNRADAAFEAECRDRARRAAEHAAAERERVGAVVKNIPRLKASDLFKAGVLFLPERGEQPGPEKFGPKLIAYGSVHGTKDWYTVTRDYDEWVEPADGLRVDDIECWMLPLSLKE